MKTYRSVEFRSDEDGEGGIITAGTTEKILGEGSPAFRGIDLSISPAVEKITGIFDRQIKRTFLCPLCAW